MVRLKLPPEEKRSEVVFVLLLPSEKRALEKIREARATGEGFLRTTISRGALLREAFLSVHSDAVSDECMPVATPELKAEQQYTHQIL